MSKSLYATVVPAQVLENLNLPVALRIDLEHGPREWHRIPSTKQHPSMGTYY